VCRRTAALDPAGYRYQPWPVHETSRMIPNGHAGGALPVGLTAFSNSPMPWASRARSLVSFGSEGCEGHPERRAPSRPRRAFGPLYEYSSAGLDGRHRATNSNTRVARPTRSKRLVLSPLSRSCTRDRAHRDPRGDAWCGARIRSRAKNRRRSWAHVWRSDTYSSFRCRLRSGYRVVDQPEQGSCRPM